MPFKQPILEKYSGKGFDFEVFVDLQDPSITIARGVTVRGKIDGKIITIPHSNGATIGDPESVGRRLSNFIPTQTKSDKIDVFAGQPSPGQVEISNDLKRCHHLATPPQDVVIRVRQGLDEGRVTKESRETIVWGLLIQTYDQINGRK